ncbi:MAG: AMP-binding protein [Candidatus Saganbacteria bacterium]|nr:AMP-binding protein [Candidatus Saganbacteria bacterium]
MLKKNTGRYAHLTAYQIRQADGYKCFTFQQVADLAVRLRAKLAGQGVIKGARVILLSENRPEWAIAYLAVTSMGAIVVPLDAMQQPDDLKPLIEDSGAVAAVVSAQYIGHLAETGLQAQAVRMEDLGTLPPAGQGLPDQVGLDDVASIVYTSGTTGIPKGVVLTHRNIMSNVMAVASLFDLGPKDNFLSVLPLHHTFETTAGFLGPFYMGCRVTYAESLKSHAILRNMQETGVTIMCGVPLLYQLFYDGILREVEERSLQRAFTVLFGLARFFKHIIGVNLGSWLFKTVHKKFGGKIRFFVSGGAALDPEVAANFSLMGFTILQGYGLSESAPVLTCNTLKQNKLGSVGRPIPGVEIRIAGTDPVGEILAFGPNIMKGYYKRKELSSRVVVNGWLYTGDVGYIDEDGFLFITGRSKDVIVTGSGVNVYPEEVEFALNKLPAVLECCVMGDKVTAGARRNTEEVMALIVPDMEYFDKLGCRDEAFIKRTLDQQVAELNQQLADFKRVARFVIRQEELPKTRLKKIKRFELKKELGI